jgi:hypothetical protein
MDSRSVTLAEEKELETGPTSSPQGSLRYEKAGLENSPADNENGSLQNDANEEVGVDEAEYPKGAPLALIVVALVLSIFLVSPLGAVCECEVADIIQVALDMTIVATAIPKITDEFHGLDLVGWYGAAFFMTVGGFQSTWGKAYKYFPLKLTFLTSIFVFEIGSLLCGTCLSLLRGHG